MSRQKTPPMRTLSKSKLLSFRQCPKRLWLEIHQPDLCQNSAATEAKIEEQLPNYCHLDTYALVRLWQYFSGRNELVL